MIFSKTFKKYLNLRFSVVSCFSTYRFSVKIQRYSFTCACDPILGIICHDTSFFIFFSIVQKLRISSFYFFTLLVYEIITRKKE